MPLHVVPPAPPPEETPADKVRARLKKAPKPATMLECRRCACREVLVVKIGMLYENNRAKGGTTQYLCANCHRKGERVVLA